jgi:tRNA 2-thiouridine synthesizing protein A
MAAAVEFDALSSVVHGASPRRLNCPLPILRAKKALADMESGQILKVLATDPGSQRDFAAFAKQTGNEIVEVSTQDKVFVFLMRRR